MLIFGALGFLVAQQKSKRVKIIFVSGGILLPIIWLLSIIDFTIVMVLAGTSFGHTFLLTHRFDVPLHNSYQWSARMS
jgi:hypothetical protein